MANQSLSQVINNITNTSNQLNSVLALLPSPVSNQAGMQSALSNCVPTLQGIQTQILAYTTQASTDLTDALNSFNSSNYASTSTIVQKVNADANVLKTNVTNSNNTLGIIAQQIAPVITELTTMNNNLLAQSASLNGQLQDAKNQVDYYSKRKYYFLLLGPFGLVGLGIAAGFLISWTNKANDFQNQINNINRQIASVNNSNAAVQNVQTATINAISSVSFVNNTIDVLSSDITEIVTDLSSVTPATAKLYITAANTEVQLLANDAS
jgi:hypothetical protein